MGTWKIRCSMVRFRLFFLRFLFTSHLLLLPPSRDLYLYQLPSVGCGPAVLRPVDSKSRSIRFALTLSPSIPLGSPTEFSQGRVSRDYPTSPIIIPASALATYSACWASVLVSVPDFVPTSTLQVGPLSVCAAADHLAISADEYRV